MKVGFIGLGTLGLPMAQRIARTGHPLIACDIFETARDTFASFNEPGAMVSGDPMAVARDVDVLSICVRTDQDVRDLVDGGALFEALGAGGIMIMHSTIDPALCRELETLGEQHGAGFLDVGISPGGPAALEGKSSLYVGGKSETVAKAMPLLRDQGNPVHLGPAGRGMEAKLLNNLISIANYGTSVAILDLAEKLGFDKAQLHETLMGGSANSFALRVAPGFTAPDRAANMQTLLGKDVDHARILAPAEDESMLALMPPAEALIRRLARAAREAAGG